jgi:putative protease
VKVRRDDVVLDMQVPLHSGDGLCFFNGDGELQGTLVNRVAGNIVTPEKMDELRPGFELYRNHDHEFVLTLERSRNERRIAVRFKLRADGQIEVRDEDGNAAELSLAGDLAAKPESALQNLRRQLDKTGDTEFSCKGVELESAEVPFLPVSALNSVRRSLLVKLRELRAQNRPKFPRFVHAPAVEFPGRELTYFGNVLNRKAAEFYREHGAVRIEPAAESGLDMRGRKLMTTRYCLKYELGLCGKPANEALTLIDEEGNRLELGFDCARCEMQVYLGEGR